jgi:hypothetical protein
MLLLLDRIMHTVWGKRRRKITNQGIISPAHRSSLVEKNQNIETPLWICTLLMLWSCFSLYKEMMDRPRRLCSGWACWSAYIWSEADNILSTHNENLKKSQHWHSRWSNNQIIKSEDPYLLISLWTFRWFRHFIKHLDVNFEGLNKKFAVHHNMAQIVVSPNAPK